MEGLTMEVIGAVGFGIETNVQNDLNDRCLIMARRVFQVNSFTKIPVILTRKCILVLCLPGTVVHWKLIFSSF